MEECVVHLATIRPEKEEAAPDQNWKRCADRSSVLGPNFTITLTKA
jgi:hypothetical protein